MQVNRSLQKSLKVKIFFTLKCYKQEISRLSLESNRCLVPLPSPVPPPSRRPVPRDEASIIEPCTFETGRYHSYYMTEQLPGSQAEFSGASDIRTSNLVLSFCPCLFFRWYVFRLQSLIMKYFRFILLTNISNDLIGIKYE